MNRHHRIPIRVALVLVLGCLGTAAAGFGTGSANATPPYDWQDVTADFVAPFDPGAFTDQVHRSLILSPYGTTEKIECRAFHGPGGQCRQTDPTGTHHLLHETYIANRTVVIYKPFP
ncbi:hypothetical protein [Rhodococcus jostii]|uniref:hypothetical protein n=1 Tax=Rhodococcus jostii TaxID=132919 RepID=UPI00363C2FC0